MNITCPNCELGSDECSCSNGIKIHGTNYRPLPDDLTIKNSKIEGLGLFATSFIHSGMHLGVTHLEIDGFKLIRTGLGAFL